MVNGIRPRDDTEAMLAAQMTAARNAMITAARRLAKAETIELQDGASNMFNKCARTFVAQMQALKKYRSTREQSIKVPSMSMMAGKPSSPALCRQGGNGKKR
jgi:hypothetical protein